MIKKGNLSKETNIKKIFKMQRIKKRCVERES